MVTPELNAHRWIGSSASARRMIVEYCKYLAILARESLIGEPKAKA